MSTGIVTSGGVLGQGTCLHQFPIYEMIGYHSSQGTPVNSKHTDSGAIRSMMLSMSLITSMKMHLPTSLPKCKRVGQLYSAS